MHMDWMILYYFIDSSRLVLSINMAFDSPHFRTHVYHTSYGNKKRGRNKRGGKGKGRKKRKEKKPTIGQD